MRNKASPDNKVVLHPNLILGANRVSELTELVAVYGESILRNSIYHLHVNQVLEKFRLLLSRVQLSSKSTENSEKRISHPENVLTLYKLFSDDILGRFTDQQNAISRQKLLIGLMCLNIAHGKKGTGMERYKQALLSFVQDNPAKKIPELINLINREEERINLAPELRGKISGWLKKIAKDFEPPVSNHGPIAANDSYFHIPKLEASKWKFR